MTHGLYNRAHSVLLGISAGIFSAGTARAADTEHELDSWFRFLGNLNKYSALESAGSRGSIGVGLGLGARSETVEATSLYRAQMERDETEADEGVAGRDGADAEGEIEDETVYVPRFWLVKGTPWPVDFGISAASTLGRELSQAGGHVQWTPYEALGMPAVTLRARYGRLYGASGTQFESYGLDLVAGYGFLRYFTVYGVAGATRHAGRMDIAPESKVGFLLAGDEEARVESRTWFQPNRAVGLTVMAWPPFVAVTGEADWEGGDVEAYTAKLSVGM